MSNVVYAHIAWMFVSIGYVFIYVYVYVYAYICVCIYIPTYTLAYIVCMLIYVCVYIYTYICRGLPIFFLFSGGGEAPGGLSMFLLCSRYSEIRDV